MVREYAVVVPWCDPCDRFYNPNTLLVDGSCPRCNTRLDGDHESHDAHDDAPSVSATIPWHFWVVLALVAAYLGWRVIDGIAWVIEVIF